ncbi:hypothetical protein SCBWM1_gp3 [Synechococcus phage S-CBWM1]|uniref:Uncharacterized protein n=1 Tax=Synechococcus phage S-CBWM1 TaxID=2053653 RepID=A0A3G1L316_9CAUD|nr:hypothetical protein HOU61_gp004 [Synechococcus phage S-CBWM1]ATW62687.1 hypothetical protein SCBWM1_gp3 [Synechococcus phage S-CBWM1]
MEEMSFKRSVYEEFLNNRGIRGIHFIVDEAGREEHGFLKWDQALRFLEELGEKEVDNTFTEVMASYNPDQQALAMVRNATMGKNVALALFPLP